MQVRVLGCSGGIGADLRTTAFLVDEDILVDAGTGVGDLTPEEMQGIRHVFVSHCHLDHVCSIPLLANSLFSRTDEALVVHAPQVTIDALRRHLFNGEIWPDFSVLPDPERPVVRFEALEAGDSRSIRGRTFEAIEVRHAVPAVGYRCSDAVSAVCFSGDTSSNESLWSALNTAGALDLLIVEVGYCDADEAQARQALHYCPRLLAADLAQLDSKPRIAVTHLKPGDEERTMAELRTRLPDYDLVRLQRGDSFRL